MDKVASIATVGIISGLAYLAAQAADIAATGHNTDDRLLAGGLVPGNRDNSVMTGTVMHLVNSIAFSAMFRLVGRDLLAGPMWFRGLVFALIESVALYPMVMFERLHPAIRDGRLRSYRTPVAFGQQLWRHAVLGVVLGLLTPKRD